jgi:Fe-S-cluster-containing dehydrogenase component
MRYGFVIDQNRCIGCHACTVACKEEHNIAVGVNRTWVKYIEKGQYPDTRRHFAVLRCNHCDDAPCIEICPTVALFRRSNGIVDFDNERCIGCKSCMQACPYDALYIDPDRNTAAKCNFDASRVEMGYKPACEVVCPTQAILSGDLDDPNSEISRRVAMEKVSVRKPEKGTKPKLFYVGVEGDLLSPTMMEQQSTYLWADKQPGEDLYALSNGKSDRPMPGAREVYDVPHITPWGRKIATYLWTKSISAGVLLLSALFVNMGFEQDAVVLNFISPAVSLIFLLATMFFLVFDSKSPAGFSFS